MQVLPVNTTVRYEGSIKSIQGLYGWITEVTKPNPAAALLAVMEEQPAEVVAELVRYNVTLVRDPWKGSDRVYLKSVRHGSLVAGPNLG